MNTVPKPIVVVILSILCFLLIGGMSYAADPFYTYSAEAQALNDLGLYKGVSVTSFDPDLGSALDRQTGVVMLLRMFALEQEALAMTDVEVNTVLSHFSDAASIASWAKKQAAYAVQNDLVKGISATEFGPTANLNGKMYCTLILRQLGHTPNYDNASAELETVGGLTASEAIKFNDKPLIKDDLVGISYGALSANDSDGVTVIEKLVESGAVDPSEAEMAGLIDWASAPETLPPTITPTPTPTPTTIVDTNRATGGTSQARGDNASANEGNDKAFDGNISTKWLDFSATSWIQYEFANDTTYRITKYTITSGNDYPDRDPKAWTLKGSNNAVDWVVLDTQNNQSFSSRFQKKAYTVSNSTAYKYYKFDNIVPQSGSMIQLSEIELIESN